MPTDYLAYIDFLFDDNSEIRLPFRIIAEDETGADTVFDHVKEGIELGRYKITKKARPKSDNSGEGINIKSEINRYFEKPIPIVIVKQDLPELELTESGQPSPKDDRRFEPVHFVVLEIAEAPGVQALQSLLTLNVYRWNHEAELIPILAPLP